MQHQRSLAAQPKGGILPSGDGASRYPESTMNLHQVLFSSGMEQLAHSASIRAGVFRRSGLAVDELEMLTSAERLDLQWIQSQLTMKSLSSANDLAEHDRLVVLLHRETGEAQTWLQKLPLERLRTMMDAIESSWN